MTELPLNQILCGDCAELLQGFPDNSVDLVATDPQYGLGFMGLDWDQALPSREAFKEINRVLKPGALAFVMSSPRQDLMARMILLLEDAGFKTDLSFMSWIYKTGFPKAYDVSKGIDQKLGLEREKDPITYRQFEDISGGNYNRKDGLTKSTKILYTSFPVSDEAKEWDGWKSQTGLKPAQEPVLMVYKPRSEPTIVDNVLRWGTGAINVDATRIPIEKGDKSAHYGGLHETPAGYSGGFSEGYRTKEKPGRFPANLLVSDGALDTGEITESNIRTVSKTELNNEGYREANVYGKYHENKNIRGIDDLGDQSRYFDLDAWTKHHGFLDVPKPDTKERDFGLRGPKREPKSKFNKSDGKNERFDGATSTPRRNTHPTVKPIKLMAYLIELGCPRNGVVLDPFVGSGTTCIAAKQLGRRYIGIEIKPEYHVLAEARVAAHPQPLEWFQEAQDVR